MWTQPQRPAVLVIFSEDGYRGGNYQLDLKFPPQYVPKQNRSGLIMDTGTHPADAHCAILSPSVAETPVNKNYHQRAPVIGAAAGSYVSNVPTCDSVVIPLRTPTEKGTPRRQANPIRRTLISGYWSPVSCFSTSSGPTCRICFDGSAKEDLISPCDCCGTLELVHRSCLEKWLSTSNTRNCEVCQHRFDVQHERRPVWKWFTSKDAANGPQGFYADLICVLIVTSMCIASVYMCAMGATTFIQQGSWKGSGLILLCISLTALYVLFIYVTFKYYWGQLRKWQTSNQLVHLVHWNYIHREQKRNEARSIEAQPKNQREEKTEEEQSAGDCSPCSFTTIDLESSFTNLESST